jgi:hypothetical protein
MYTLAFTGVTLLPYVIGAAVLGTLGLASRAKARRAKD